MNNRNAIQQIINEYITEFGNSMGAEAAKCENEEALKQVYKAGEDKASEGLRKLEALKLTREDRKGMRKLRGAFKATIKCCNNGARGRFDKANKLISEAAALMFEYTAEVMRS